MADEKEVTQNLRGRPAAPAAPGPAKEAKSTTDDDLRPLGQGGQLDPEAVARRWEKWSKYLVPAILATLVSLATGLPTVMSVYRDGMSRLETKTDKAQQKGDKVELEQKAVYTKVTKPEIEDLKAQIAELKADMVADRAAKRVGQRRRPIPVVAVPKPKPLPASPAAVLQAPAPVPAPPPKPADAGQ
jgi:hypothetical protein